MVKTNIQKGCSGCSDNDTYNMYNDIYNIYNDVCNI